jgi:hypothetical protein
MTRPSNSRSDWTFERVRDLLEALPGVDPRARIEDLNAWASTIWRVREHWSPPNPRQARDELNALVEAFDKLSFHARALLQFSLNGADPHVPGRLIHAARLAAQRAADAVNKAKRETSAGHVAGMIATAYLDLTGRQPPTTDPNFSAKHPYQQLVRDLFEAAGLKGWEHRARSAARELKKGKNIAPK